MKKFTTAAFIIAAIIVATPATQVFANKGANKKEVATSNTSNIDVKYLGEKGEYTYLQIELTQQANTPATLRITDGLGESFFTEKVSGRTHTRIVKLLPNEVNSLEVIYSTAAGVSKKAFNISVSNFKSTAIEEVAAN